jgi:hypothetical protein
VSREDDWQADRNVDAKLRNRPEALMLLGALGTTFVAILFAALLMAS